MIDLYPLVYVEWRDAEHEGAWSDPRDEEAYSINVCSTIGWLIHKNKQRLVIASTVSIIMHQVANKQYIPVNMVTKYKIIKKGKKRG